MSLSSLKTMKISPITEYSDKNEKAHIDHNVSQDLHLESLLWNFYIIDIEEVI
jgi:hypothetical protein